MHIFSHILNTYHPPIQTILKIAKEIKQTPNLNEFWQPVERHLIKYDLDKNLIQKQPDVKKIKI